MKKGTQLNVFLTMLFSWSVYAARGPHHPRGSAIVKRHTHYTPSSLSGKLTQDVLLLHDRDHIQEHIKEDTPRFGGKELNDDELELYYFLLHDRDKNAKLDGFELLEALMHTIHADPSKEQHSDVPDVWAPYMTTLDDSFEKASPFKRFTSLVDQVLREDDLNRDGYLDYAEYVQGRAKDSDESQNNLQHSVQQV